MRALVLALMLTAAGAVFAQTAKVDVTPAEAFAAAIDARGEPSAEDAFDCEGVLLLGGGEIGSFRFSAAVVEEEGKKLYRVVDLGRMALPGQTHTAETRTWLDRRLTSVRGVENREDNGAKSSARWTRTEAGYRVVEKRGEGEEQEKVLAAPEGLVSNVSGVILLARALPAEAGTYAFQSLNALSDDGEDVEEILLTAQGKKQWNDAPALLFHRRDGERDITFALDPESRAFLGMRIGQEGGPVVEFRPGRAVALPAAADPFAPPAKDAKQCALIAALAYGTGDGELLASIADWDSIAADLKAKHPDKEFDPVTLRSTVVANLNAHEGKQPRDTVAPVILTIAGAVKVTEEGDRATAVFPPAFNNLTIHVARFGNEWRMVALPGT